MIKIIILSLILVLILVVALSVISFGLKKIYKANEPKLFARVPLRIKTFVYLAFSCLIVFTVSLLQKYL